MVSIMACEGVKNHPPTAPSQSMNSSDETIHTISKVQPHAPIGNITVESLKPEFTVGNAKRVGSKDKMNYLFEISKTESFEALVASGPVEEQEGETTFQ